MNDSELLRRFVDEQSQDAFAEIVRRRVGLVYAAALRQIGGDAHRAEDVTQEVFIDLARKARELARHPSLIGWLYTSTHFAAAKTIRGEQRRSRREVEAHAMHDLSVAPAAEPNWDRVRPVLDAAMHDLSERDRQTVLLRFFDQQPFARIGEQLGVSENAAQKAVERALDKLEAALARRGVSSTAAALGLALASQAAGAVPPAMAASVTGVALAGASTAAAGGALAWFTAGKVVAGLTGAAAIVTGGVAIVKHDEARQAEAALIAVEQQHRALAARVAALDARTQRADQRAAEAERDNESLLKAIKEQQEAAKAAAKSVTKVLPPPPSDGGQIVAMVPAGDDEAITQQRVYQQALARHRAEEAKARANVDDTVTRMDDVSAYHRLINLARHLRDEGSFQEAIRTYNKAMTIKPAGLEVTAEIRQLQQELQAQNLPVDITLISDGLTWVTVTNYRQPAKFSSANVRFPPGNYQIVGRRKGYRDVVLVLTVRSGKPVGPITVICTEALNNG